MTGSSSGRRRRAPRRRMKAAAVVQQQWSNSRKKNKKLWRSRYKFQQLRHSIDIHGHCRSTPFVTRRQQDGESFTDIHFASMTMDMQDSIVRTLKSKQCEITLLTLNCILSIYCDVTVTGS